jgi:hypothetical protein
VRLYVADHHIHAFALALMGGLKHGKGLAHARGVTEEYLEPSPATFLYLGLPQQDVGIRTGIHHGLFYPFCHTAPQPPRFRGIKTADVHVGGFDWRSIQTIEG